MDERSGGVGNLVPVSGVNAGVSVLLRKFVSWLVVVLGILSGVAVLVLIGQIYDIPTLAKPLEEWLQFVGPCLFGLVTLIGSFVALRNRRRAGLLYSMSAPILAFLLAYPMAGVVVFEPDGNGYLRLPPIIPAVALTVVIYVLLYFSLFATRSRLRMICFVLILIAVISFAVATYEWPTVLLPRLLGWLVLVMLFGGFWLGTDRLGWHGLLSAAPRGPVRRIAVLLVECLLVLILVLSGTLVFAALRSSLHWPDCSGWHLFAKPVDPGHAVFTVRVIRAGHAERISGRWAGEWAIGVVEELFGGLPRWTRLVFLTNHVFWEGETFFVSGRRDQGLVARFLPMVDATPCGYDLTQLVAEAKIPLRVLRNPLPAEQRRIIGNVMSWKLPRREPESPAMTSERRRTYEWILRSSGMYAPLAGARVSLTGSSGTSVVTTDQNGIYDFPAVPLDSYTVRLLDVPANQAARDGRVPRLELERFPVFQANLEARWDGSVEGRVRDAAGGPAQAWIGLRELDGALSQAERSEKDGSFRIGGLPVGGRYILEVNPYGPAQWTPYASGYYPMGVRREQAKVLEIKAEDAHIKNLEMVVTRLVERTLDVRASWPDGKPVDGADIYMALEHSKEWDDPTNSSRAGITENGGVATIRLWGDSRVRVIARFVEDREKPTMARYSTPVELDPSHLPARLELVIR